MFQTYDDIADPNAGAKRTGALRAELKTRGLTGFVVPRSDSHMNEYVPPGEERLAWLTGFSGSAGLAVVLEDRAAIFVDGRYTLQVRGEADLDLYEIRHMIDEPPARWIEEHLIHGARLGLDPWLHTVKGVGKLRKAAEKAGATLVACETNPIDAIWEDRPPPPLAPAIPHPLDYAGETSEAKIARLAEELEKADVDAAVLTLCDSVAWAFNIRGQDVAHTPLALAFAILYADGKAELFIDERKVTDALRTHLGKQVRVLPPDSFGHALDAMGAQKREVRLDPATAASWIHNRLTRAGATIKPGGDPCILPKARKNAAEIAGARAAHVRDGAAVCCFLAWLDRNGGGNIDEVEAARRLEKFRIDTGALKDISFDTISGAGPHGAIVHYRVSERTSRKLEPGSLYLVDSGGQYVDGTTDITRTVAIGEPADDMRRHFTLVLKGHIAIATAHFPKGTRGCDLDAFARMALWKAGLDYDHGTGHGVGSYLSVHEGPQRLSRHGTAKLEPGMILSNEPGYYKPEHYGIRIENLMLVEEARDIDGGEKPMMGFETLTLVPIDRRLVVAQMLTEEECNWLNAYHARVREIVGAELEGEEREWLEEATQPVS